MRQDFGVFKRDRRGLAVYYYYFYDEDGSKHQRSTGQTVKAKALKYVYDKYKEGTLFDHPYSRTKLSAYAEPFWIPERCPIVTSKRRRGGSLTNGSCKQNRAHLINHILPVFGKLTIDKITPQMVENWLLNLPKDKDISNNTANKAFTVFRQILDVAVQDRIITINPCSNIKPLTKKDKEKGTFTIAQVKAILEAEWNDEMAYVACLLAATTGMRMGEIRGLTVENIHDDYIKVCQAWGENDGLKSTKSGRTRDVPILKEVHDLLIEVAPEKNHGFVFTYNLVKPVDYKFITKRLKKIMDTVGIDYKAQNLSFHSFRHFFNTRLVAAGIKGEIVRSVIGHESEEMTDHYLHLQASDMQYVRSVAKEISNFCKKIS